MLSRVSPLLLLALISAQQLLLVTSQTQEPQVQRSYEAAQGVPASSIEDRLGANGKKIVSYLKGFFGHHQQNKAEPTTGVKSAVEQKVPVKSQDKDASYDPVDSNNSTETQISSSIPVHPTDHSNNDARQSSLFSGLGLGGGGLGAPANLAGFQNQLGAGGLFRPPVNMPQFPKLPDLSMRPPQYLMPPQPAKPKNSIIGGGSGPMALTNDNVVVVNVFSNN